MPPVFVGTSQFAAHELGQSKRGQEARRVQARVGRDIMRSGVQPHHLHGIEKINVGKRLPPDTDARYKGYIGHDEGYVEHADPYTRAQSRDVKNARQFHLIHEIGHHQDRETRQPELRLGVTEGRADNFARANVPASNKYTSGYERYNLNQTPDERMYNAVRRGEIK